MIETYTLLTLRTTTRQRKRGFTRLARAKQNLPSVTDSSQDTNLNTLITAASRAVALTSWRVSTVSIARP